MQSKIFSLVVLVAGLWLTDAAALPETSLQFKDGFGNYPEELSSLNDFYDPDAIPYQLIQVVHRQINHPTQFTSRCISPLKINYIKFDFARAGFRRIVKANKGAVVILPGRGESSFKYAEFAYDLFLRGHGPFYVLDHRGQGLSERIDYSWRNHHLHKEPTLVGNHEVANIDSFSCYVEDVDQFLHEVVAPEVALDQVHIIAHSLGGAVLTRYLLNEVDPAGAVEIPKVVMISPLYGIPRLQTILSNFVNHPEEALESALSIFRCLADLRSCPALLQKNLFSSRLVYDAKNDSTTSVDRYLNYRLTMGLWPQAITSSLTVAWFEQAQAFLTELHRSSVKGWPRPTLMFEAGDDKVVDLTALESFCHRLNADNGGHPCRLIGGFSKARHALHTERDVYRDQLIHEIDAFFTE